MFLNTPAGMHNDNVGFTEEDREIQSRGRDPYREGEMAGAERDGNKEPTRGRCGKFGLRAAIDYREKSKKDQAGKTLVDSEKLLQYATDIGITVAEARHNLMHQLHQLPKAIGQGKSEDKAKEKQQEGKDKQPES